MEEDETTVGEVSPDVLFHVPNEDPFVGFLFEKEVIP